MIVSLSSSRDFGNNPSIGPTYYASWMALIIAGARVSSG